ncbi:MAG: carboxypeptidase regulatory-like domain-containing protein, partial [Prevotellaceae bacterium]|nr:carboxypeptidase regulatory-like domain-containing protein [Prevotellaceae bacterium]
MLKNRVSDVRYNAIALDHIRNALNSLLKVNEYNPNNARLNYAIGKCYYYLHSVADAIPYLQKAKQLSEKKISNIDYFLGQAYHVKGDFDAAISAYEVAISNTKDLDDIDKLQLLINQARYAKNMLSAPLDILVENMGEAVNTPLPEYLPVVAEKDKAIIFQRYDNGGNDLHVTFNRDKNWTQAVPTGQKFNLAVKEFFKPITLVDASRNPLVSRLFYVDYPFGDKNYLYETVVSISSNGTSGYMTSSRNVYDATGNGSAIFETTRNPRGEWVVRPRTLGLKPHLALDEFGVVLHPNDKILYFSSRGYQTIGGFDIYKSVFDGLRWSKPENMGYPVNSTGDDIVYGISEDGNKLYISSNRSGGYGDHDLYAVTLMPGFVPPATVSPAITADGKQQPAEPSVPEPKVQYPAALRGFVTDEVTYKPIKDVSVIIKDVKTNEEEAITTDETGMFQTTLTAGVTYELQVSQSGYTSYTEQIPIADGRGQRVSKYIKLSPTDAATTAATTVTEKPSPEEPTAPAAPVTTTVSGRLVDVNANNKPVANAIVAVADKATNKTQQVKTDADGYFKAIIPANTPYTVSVLDSKYAPYTAEVGVNEKLPPVIALKAAAVAIEGRIVDANNKPLANIPVVVTDAVTKQAQKVTTDAQGKFKTTIPAGNAYTVSVTDEKHEPYTAKVGVNEKLPPVIALKAAAVAIEGRIVDANNKPLANIPVVVTDAVTKQAQKVTTDAQGKFKTTIPAGNAYTVSVTDEKHEPYTAKVGVNEKLPPVIALKAAAVAIEGRIVDANNKPLANIPVVVTDAVTKQAQKVTTDAQGKF